MKRLEGKGERRLLFSLFVREPCHSSRPCREDVVVREHPPNESFCLSVTTAAAAASAEEVSWQPGWVCASGTAAALSGLSITPTHTF